jgi:hypothetical protein
VVALGVGAAGAAPLIVSTAETEVTIGGLACGTQYRVRVNVAGNSTVTTLNPVTKPCPPLRPPPRPPTSCTTPYYACSGFELNTSLLARTSQLNQWRWLSGVDQSTGFDWTPARMWGSSLPMGVLDIVGSQAPSSGTPCDFVCSEIASVTGFNGNPTRALKLWVKQKNTNPSSTGQQAGFGESMFNTGSTVSRDYWMKARWRLDPTLLTKANAQGNQFWWQSWVSKTPINLRFQLGIMNHQPPGPHWYIRGDGGGASCSTTCRTVYWQELPPNKVPLDQWFDVEIAYKMRNDTTGYFKFYVNGQQVLNRLGENDGPSNENVNNMAHAITYVNQFVPMWMLVDDVEVRSEPPCATMPCGP